VKSSTAVAFMLILSSPAPATITADVYLSDGNTPLALRDPNVPHVYRDVMVGTKLTIIVSSNSLKGTGSIGMSWEDWAKGRLTARGFDESTRYCDGSCLPAAGCNADVIYTPDSSMTMYCFFPGTSRVYPGRWFIFDYLAKSVGTCTITVGDATSKPLVATTLTLNHVPSRDFNGDTVVNLKDFALFANYWRRGADSDCNSVPCQFDLNADGRLDAADLSLFRAFWLERTDANAPLIDPNALKQRPQGTPEDNPARPD
jgi:hypothetical protein